MENNKKVYIKGDSKNGEKVIKILESHGGVNDLCMTGTLENHFYYIKKNGFIRCIGISVIDELSNKNEQMLINNGYTRISLDGETYKKLYFKGNLRHCRELILELEKNGGLNAVCWVGDSAYLFYYISDENKIETTKNEQMLINNGYKEIHYYYKKLYFKGDRVNGEKLIESLIEQGANNRIELSGTCESFFYYIGENGRIGGTADEEYLIERGYTMIKLECSTKDKQDECVEMTVSEIEKALGIKNLKIAK